MCAVLDGYLHDRVHAQYGESWKKSNSTIRFVNKQVEQLELKLLLVMANRKCLKSNESGIKATLFTKCLSLCPFLLVHCMVKNYISQTFCAQGTFIDH